MTYTREQRAANAAKAAASAAAQAAPPAPQATPAPQESAESQPTITVAKERPAYRNDDRSAAFAEIEARHNRTSGNEPPPEEPAEEEAPPPRRQVRPPQDRVAAPEPASPPLTVEPGQGSEIPISAPDEPVEMLTVKVDGEEFQVPKSDVEDAGGVRAYQTIRAADNRLKKSQAILAETRQTQAQIAQFARAAMPQQEAPKKLTADEAFQAIRFGTPEEGWNILNKIVDEKVGKPVDPDQLMNRTMVEMEKIRSAKQFMTEFADIAQNPILYKTAVQMDRERMLEAFQAGQIGPQFDFADHYRKIGNEIRGAFGRSTQTASAPPTAGTPSQPSDKEARKASIVNLPTTSARAELSPEAKPDSRDDILNSYRKSRGQSPV